MEPLSCNDRSASMLTELYGVDTGSMKKSLEVLFIKSKRKQFTERKKTEYKNRFNEAFTFFEKRGCIKGIKKIKDHETNFFDCSSQKTTIKPEEFAYQLKKKNQKLRC